jgi:hypothetical protein
MKAVDAAVIVPERDGITVAFGLPGAAIDRLHGAPRKRSASLINGLATSSGTRLMDVLGIELRPRGRVLGARSPWVLTVPQADPLARTGNTRWP